MMTKPVTKLFLSLLCGAALSVGCGAADEALLEPQAEGGSAATAPADSPDDDAMAAALNQGVEIATAAATCHGAAITPFFTNGRTYAEGVVSCSGRATIPATICLERSNGTTVHCHSATETFSGNMYWWAWATGCNSSVSYRSHLISNGVNHYSGWRQGCR